MIEPCYVRIAFISMFTICLSACAASLQGTVSAISYNGHPQSPLFFVISTDSFSVTERNISALIEAKLTEKGFQKANSLELANVGVIYKYSIDQSGSIHSVPAGQGSTTFTTYPRHFQIALIDLQKSKIPEKIEFLWQGEVYSAGTSRNIALIAPSFIEVLFENYGKTVSNKNFSKQIE